jgi:MoaA/NifB/PqqE/SkfB family radical SAM enzyme
VIARPEGPGLRRLHWVELTPDYRCNNRCIGCFAVQDDGPAMTDAEVVRALQRGRADGADCLWLGGGEPTLRKDIFRIAAMGRRLGYTRVKLQTNGMMLAYPGYARRCADAGITEVALSMKGASAATHDRIARTEGCFDLMARGAVSVREAGVALEGDLLITASNASELPAMVALGLSWGARSFRVWLLSAVDQARDDLAVRAEVPRMSDVVPALVAAVEANADARFELVSLHTPACVLPEALHGALFDAAGFGMRVVNPGGHAFDLADSPIEGGYFLPGCAQCRHRPRCNGLRRDYLAVHGEDEFRPVA